ncbi:DUF1792 domain-containing protein [Companilactobacillus zhachilii]|uniref:DUF1792 domain-containing protein n=1 Tax=Companilactobacillus zhachilii TaxID=2304606 RepID=A0A386PVP9_9LACO|nr:GT-D fold domain-containing glycosyltransferase [Companilactobacillus zhachilii]AYE39025.1 DUF1792 domain-containing protein [Companilactobacillus zhachilii]
MFRSKIKDYLRFLKWRIPYKRSIKKFPIKTLNFDDTVDLIIRNKLSVSRFGDGEFRFLLSKDTGGTFEINSRRLSTELKNILIERNDKVLICLPSVYKSINNLKFEDKVFWQREVSIYLKQYYKYLPKKVYGDAFFTRPYQEYSINDSLTEYKFKKIKRIWDERNILLVEGRLTRFGVGNDLLKNAHSVKRILAPEVNAFEKIDCIYDAVENGLKGKHDDTLVLLSLGPTATVLSAKLSNNLNVQAIDIGHLDIEYEWFIRRATKKIPIKGKYVNESINSKFIESKVNKKYLSEIVDEIE